MGDEETPRKLPVVYEIDFRGNKGLFKLSKGYSAYDEENEVLIQDGLKYLVTGIKEMSAACRSTVSSQGAAGERGSIKYTLISLQYPI